MKMKIVTDIIRYFSSGYLGSFLFSGFWRVLSSHLALHFKFFYKNLNCGLEPMI